MKAISLNILILLFLPLTSSYSQEEKLNEEWRWVHFTTETGLPSDKVLDIVETSDGTVWAVTANGLAWYDGFRWHTVQDTSAIFHKRPNWVVADNDSTILFVVEKYLYRGSMHAFNRIRVQEHNKDSVILLFAPIGKQKYLVIAADQFATIPRTYVYKDALLVPLETPSPIILGTFPSFFYSRGMVWINTEMGPYIWDGEEWMLTVKKERRSNTAHNIVRGKNGLTITCLSGGPNLQVVWEWKKNDKAVFINDSRQENIQTLDISPDGKVLAIYQSGNVQLGEMGKWRSLRYSPPRLKNALFVKFRDNGDLWVGTESGLFLCRLSLERWKYLIHPFPDMKNTVNEIIQSPDGAIWIGTRHGVEVYKPNGDLQLIDRINNQELYDVTGLCDDGNGNVWISSGSMFEGAYRWNGRQWQHFGEREGLSARRVHKIKKDAYGRIWFLGIGENNSIDSLQPGAFVYSEGKFSKWDKQTGLLSGRVYSFSQTNDKALWFAELGGLSRWKNSVWTYWKEFENHPIFPFALVTDKSQKMWFADRSFGIGFVDEQNDMHFLNTSDGLINNNVWDIRFDTNGILWIATHGGISSYSDGTFSTFSLSSGLNSLMLWPILPLEDRLYVGTNGNGVSVLSFEEMKNPRPHIEIGSPLIEGSNVEFSWRAFSFWGELSQQEIETRFRINNEAWSNWSTEKETKLAGLPQGDYTLQVQAKGLFGYYDSLGQRITFTIVPPYYLRTQFVVPVLLLLTLITYLGVSLTVRKRRHAITLRESETRLQMVTETTSSAIFIFDNLYIRYINSSAVQITGYTKGQLLTMSFSDIVHPEHREFIKEKQQQWQQDNALPNRCEFKIMTRGGDERWVDCTLGNINYEGVSVAMATANEITDRKESEVKLRSLASELSLTEEKERRRIAASLHDTISQVLAFCQIKLVSLNKTRSAAKRTELIKDITALIEQSIDHAHSLTLELSPPALYELGFEDAIRWLAERMQEQHLLKIRVEDDGQLKQFGEDVRVVLFQCVREALVNVVKHSQAKAVKITLQKNNDAIHIIIDDNGIGFSPSSLINRGQRKGGFGLFNVRERLGQLGGRFEINSKNGKGTSVVMVAPLKKEILHTKGN